MTEPMSEADFRAPRDDILPSSFDEEQAIEQQNGHLEQIDQDPHVAHPDHKQLLSHFLHSDQSPSSLCKSSHPVLGNGDYGTVWKVFDRETNQYRALKICPRDRPEAGPWAQYLNEVEISNRLRLIRESGGLHYAHACLPEFYAEGDMGDYSYILMEYLETMDVQEFYQPDQTDPVDSTKSLPAHEIYHTTHFFPLEHVEIIVMQLLLAAKFLHSNNIIHRDLKPDNMKIIAFNNSPTNPCIIAGSKPDPSSYNFPIVKIIDFGLGKVVTQEELIEEGSNLNNNIRRGQQSKLWCKSDVGTPLIRSPEVFHSIGIDECSGVSRDLYSIGVAAWMFLYGYWIGFPDFDRFTNFEEIGGVRASHSFDHYELEYNQVFRLYIAYIAEQQRKQSGSHGSTKITPQPKRYISSLFREALSLLLDREPFRRHRVYQTEWYSSWLDKIQAGLSSYFRLCKSQPPLFPLQKHTVQPDDSIEATMTSAERYFVQLANTRPFEFLDTSSPELIYRNNLGVTWRIFDTAFQCWVVLKVCPSSPAFGSRFKNETRIIQYLRHLAQLHSQSPALVCLPVVYSEEINDDFFYLLLKHHNGIRLDHFYYPFINHREQIPLSYDKIPSLSLPDIESIVMQLVITVQFLTSNGIAHRDIQPSNILLIKPSDIPGNDRTNPHPVDIPIVKLLNFELAEYISHPKMRLIHEDGQIDMLCDELVGTSVFLPPEFFNVDITSYTGLVTNLFAIGITALSLIFGYCPGSFRFDLTDPAELVRVRSEFGHINHFHWEYDKMYDSYLKSLPPRTHESTSNFTDQSGKEKRDFPEDSPFHQAIEFLMCSNPQTRLGIYQSQWYKSSFQQKVQTNLRNYNDLSKQEGQRQEEHPRHTITDEPTSENQLVTNALSRSVFRSFDKNSCVSLNRSPFGTTWKIFDKVTWKWCVLKLSPSISALGTMFRNEIDFIRWLRYLRRHQPDPAFACLETAIYEDINDNYSCILTPHDGAALLDTFYSPSQLKLHTQPVYKTYDNLVLLPIDQIESLVVQLLITSRYLLRNGYLHSDIRPRNLTLLQPEDIPGNVSGTGSNGNPIYSISTPIVKIVNFDLIQHQSGDHSSPPSQVGSPLFQAPELFPMLPSSSLDSRSTSGSAVHLFSIGMTALSLLFGYCPGLFNLISGLDQPLDTPSICQSRNSTQALTELAKVRQEKHLADYQQEYEEMHKAHLSFVCGKSESLKPLRSGLTSPAFSEALSLLIDSDPEQRLKVYQSEWYLSKHSQTESNLIQYLRLCEKEHQQQSRQPRRAKESTRQTRLQFQEQLNLRLVDRPEEKHALQTLISRLPSSFISQGFRLQSDWQLLKQIGHAISAKVLCDATMDWQVVKSRPEPGDYRRKQHAVGSFLFNNLIPDNIEMYHAGACLALPYYRSDDHQQVLTLRRFYPGELLSTRCVSLPPLLTPTELPQTIFLLSLAQIEMIVMQLLLTVQFLHEHNIFHGCIRPDNLLLVSPHVYENLSTPQTHPNDLTVVKLLSFRASQIMTIPTLPSQSDPIHIHSDLYAIGNTALHLIFGSRPSQQSYRITQFDPHPQNPRILTFPLNQEARLLFNSFIGAPFLSKTPDNSPIFTQDHYFDQCHPIYEVPYHSNFYLPRCRLASWDILPTLDDYEENFQMLCEGNHRAFSQNGADDQETPLADVLSIRQPSPHFRLALAALMNRDPTKRLEVYSTQWFTILFPQTQDHMRKVFLSDQKTHEKYRSQLGLNIG